MWTVPDRAVSYATYLIIGCGQGGVWPLIPPVGSLILGHDEKDTLHHENQPYISSSSFITLFPLPDLHHYTL
jgi:hypothetical protein